MSRVYVLMKHPPHPYSYGNHIEAGVVVGVYATRAEPVRIAAEKNERRPAYFWTVQAKQVKDTE